MKQWLPGWLGGMRNRAQTATCIYLSGSAVASVTGHRISTDAEDQFGVSVRADPIGSTEQISSVLKEQVRSLGLNGSDCHVVLAPEFYNLSLVERPPVGDDELVEAVRWAVQDSVDFPMEQASLDIFDLPAAASRDRDMVFVAVARKEFLSKRVEQLLEAGLYANTVGITELSLRNLIATMYPEPDQSIGLLRMTSNSGLINVSRAAELFLSRRITGVPGDFGEQAWEAFKEQLLLQVQRSVDYYESAMSQPPCSALLVATTHSWQQRVCEFLSEMLPVPIRNLTDVLAERFIIELHNPDPVQIDWNDVCTTEANALTAALPALGGLLRGLAPSVLRDAA
ncbi:MAG: type IV pilus biogenesis protein PilM [Pseudomonadales bacterium]